MATQPSTTAIPPPLTGTTRWQNAINRLDPEVRAALAGVATRKLDVLHLVVKAADEKRKLCISRQWKLKAPDGKVIILRDVLEKISGWVNRFVAVGDVIIQYDPVHAALPWAAFRFLLNIAVGDVQAWGAMLVNLETLCQILYRCGVVENTHLKGSFTIMHHLEETLVQLYVEIFGALGTLVKYFKQATPVRILSSAVRPDHALVEMTAVYGQERELLKWMALADSELLQAIKTEAVSIAGTVTAMSKNLDAELPRLIDTSLAMRQSLDEEKLSKILLWLSMIPTALHQREIAGRRMPGSGAWLLSHPDFHSWHTSSSSSIILLHGVRGCGKSTVASMIVDHFQSPAIQPGVTAAPCAHFFCDDSHAEPDRARSDSILRSLVRQLAVDTSRGSIDPKVLSLYEARLRAAEQARVDIAKLSVEECLALLLDLTETNPAYIMIDAIDQLQLDERAILIDALRQLVDQSASIIKVFLTSCDNAHVEGLLESGATKLRVSSDYVHKDVSAFVTKQVQEANTRKRILNGAATPELLSSIKERLISGAGEMFLWVTLQLDFLCRKKTERDIVSALGTDLTTDLDQIYGRTLGYFQTLDSTASLVVVHIFSCLLYSKRPLHPEALKYTIELNQSLTETGPTDLEDLCCSLVLMDMQQGVARFCHPSVRDYMRRQDMFSASAAHRLLSDLCLRKCASGPTTAVFIGDESPVKEFYHYAAIHWPEHLREWEEASLDQEDLESLVAPFVAGLHDGSVNLAFITWMDWIKGICRDLPPYHHTRNTFETTLSESQSPLFVTCVFGLRKLLRYILEVLPGVDIDEKSATGHTGIYLASSYGHQEVVDLLLDHNADPKLECGAFGTLTRVACFRGHLNVVQGLLNRIDELKSPELFSRAYRASCLGGHANVALYLAKNATTPKSPDQHSSMLQQGIEAGLPSLVDWLTLPITLKAWGLPNLTLNAQAGLIGTAIKHGQVSVLQSTLQSRPHLMQALPKDCMAIAALSGHLTMVKYLDSIGADPKEEGRFGSALRSASLMGHEHIVRMLIGNGADATSSSTEGDALQAASMNGHVRVMEMLIQAGADVNRPGKPWGTCLQAAAWYGHKEAVGLLLDHGADVCQKGHTRDALHAAIESGHEEIAALLLDRGYQPQKGVSLPAVSRGNHSNFAFAKVSRPANKDLSGKERARVDDDTESEKSSTSERSGGQGSVTILYHAENHGDDDYDDDIPRAPSDQTHEPNAVWARNFELSAAAGDVNSLHHHLLRPEATGWAILSAIETAAIRGQVDTLRFLASKGCSRRFLFEADFEIVKVMTPAAENGQSESLEVLGDASRWVISQGLSEWTLPFHAAVEFGNLPCVAILLRHHPDPGPSFLDEFCRAIESSLKLEHHHITEFLWSWLLHLSGVEHQVSATVNGLDEKTVPTASAEMISFLRILLNPKLQGPGKPNKTFEGVFPSLLVAATQTRNPRLLELLLSRATAEGFMEGNRLSRLFEKAFLSACSQDVRAVEILLSSTACGSCFTHKQICKGIYTAALAGKGKVVRYLAQKTLGGVLSEEQRTVLYEAFLAAAYRGKTSVLRTMLDLSSFWSGIGEANKSTILTRGLVAAIENGHRKPALLLLEKGADVQTCVEEVPAPRLSSLSSTERSWSEMTPEVLLQFRPRPQRRIPGSVPISPQLINPLQAVLRGFERVAESEGSEFSNSSPVMKLSRELESLVGLLIEHGCDPDDLAGQSMYPIQNAARWANERVIQILLDAGAEPNRVGGDDDKPDLSQTYRPGSEQSTHPILLAAARPYRVSYAIVANLVKAGATLPTTRHGQLHREVLNAFSYPLHKLTALSRGPPGGWIESNAPSLDVARQVLNGGMRALLTEIFKQLPQQTADRSEFRTLLLVASTAGDRVCVKLLLKHGVPVNPAGGSSAFDSPLGCAAQYGHIHIMKDLLNAGAYVDSHMFAHHPQDAMVKAIIGGHCLAVKLLVQHGAQRTRAHGRPFLLLAVRTRKSEMVECLLQLQFPLDGFFDALLAACANGDVDIALTLLSACAHSEHASQFKSFCAPLYQACRHGHLAIVQALLQHGVDPNLRSEECLGVPLVVAASKGHLEIVMSLLEHGADPDQPAVRLQVVAARLTYTAETRPVPDTPRIDLRTPSTALEEASAKGHLKVVQELLTRHASVGDAIARTCSGSWSSGKASILELLIETVSGRSDFQMIWKRALSDKSLTYPKHLIELLLDYIPPCPEILVLAASYGSMPAVDRCLARGIDPNMPNQQGDLPLASAAHGLHKDVVRRLVSEGANVKEPNMQGQTPLLAAVDGFRTSLATPLQSTVSSHSLDVEDIVRCLVEGGARAACGDSTAGNVLEIACSLGHAGVVTILLAHSELSGSWKTGLQDSLFAALDAEHPDVVSILLKEGADPQRPRLLRASDPRAQFLSTPETQRVVMIEQSPIEAACGKLNDCLMRTFLASVPALRIPPRVLTTAARAWLHQTGHVRAHCSDLALILEHDPSLVVPQTVLEILLEDYEGRLLKRILPRSDCPDPRRFQPRRLVPRAPPLLSQMRDALQPR